MEDLPASKHFSLTRLAEGVYAALQREGGAASSNAAIIDLGNHTLVLDTFDSVMAARDLRAAAEALTGRQVSYVINSHAHMDHWQGNQVFAGAAILATRQTREMMPAMAYNLIELMKDPSSLEQTVQATRIALEAESDPRQRKALQISLTRDLYQLETLKELKLTYPELVFEGRLSFYGSARTVEVYQAAPGHTSGDCYLVLPDECLAFTGDLCFFNRQPFLLGSHPLAWIENLQTLLDSCVSVFVPGHGPVGSKQEILLQIEFMQTMIQRVRQAVQNRQPVEILLQDPLPEPFTAWSVTGLPHERNTRYLYQKILEEDEGE